MENVELTENEFDEICRLCMKRVFILKAIFSETAETDNEDDWASESDTENSSESSESIGNMIFECTGLEVKENDGFPMFICNPCLDRLQASYEFKKQCLSSADCLTEIKKNPQDKSKDLVIPEVDLSPKYALDEFESDMNEYQQFQDNTKTDIMFDRNKTEIDSGSNDIQLLQMIAIESEEKFRMKQYFCSICDKIFTEKLHLDEHLEQQHSFENSEPPMKIKSYSDVLKASK